MGAYELGQETQTPYRPFNMKDICVSNLKTFETLFINLSTPLKKEKLISIFLTKFQTNLQLSGMCFLKTNLSM